MKNHTRPEKTKRKSNEQRQEQLLSNYKPRRPTEEAKKMRREMMEKLLPLMKEVFPKAKIMGIDKEKI